MPFQLHFFVFVLFNVLFHVFFGEGNRASRDYGVSACYQIVVDMTDVDWFLLSLTKVT